MGKGMEKATERQNARSLGEELEGYQRPTEGLECHIKEPGFYSVRLGVLRLVSTEPHVSGGLHTCESNLFSSSK